MGSNTRTGEESGSLWSSLGFKDASKALSRAIITVDVEVIKKKERIPSLSGSSDEQLKKDSCRKLSIASLVNPKRATYIIQLHPYVDVVCLAKCIISLAHISKGPLLLSTPGLFSV